MGGASGSQQPPGAPPQLSQPTPSGGTSPSLVDLLPASLFSGSAQPGPGGGTSVDTLPVQPAFAVGELQRSAPAAPVSALLGRTSMSGPAGSADDRGSSPARIANQLTAREWDELVDQIVERIEDRVVDELSRRGRRHDPFAI